VIARKKAAGRLSLLPGQQSNYAGRATTLLIRTTFTVLNHSTLGVWVRRMGMNAEREGGTSRWEKPGENSGVTNRYGEHEVSTSADAPLLEISRMPNVTAVAIAAVVGDYLECLLTFGSSAPPAGHPGAAGNGLTGACLATQTIQICNDINEDARIDREACEALNVKSAVILPLRREGASRALRAISIRAECIRLAITSTNNALDQEPRLSRFGTSCHD
jgi:hypothetical protein